MKTYLPWRTWRFNLFTIARIKAEAASNNVSVWGQELSGVRSIIVTFLVIRPIGNRAKTNLQSKPRSRHSICISLRSITPSPSRNTLVRLLKRASVGEWIYRAQCKDQAA